VITKTVKGSYNSENQNYRITALMATAYTTKSCEKKSWDTIHTKHEWFYNNTITIPVIVAAD